MAKKLQIIKCSSDESGTVSETSTKYSVMLNPKEYGNSKQISYSNKPSFGQIGSDNKFISIPPANLDFNFTIDGTGAIPKDESGGVVVVVQDNIKLLESTVYQYDGSQHQPGIVKIIWGSLLYYGKLKTMTLKYTLFKKDGTPLRAEVSLSFVNYIGEAEEKKRKNNQSPDMTHIVLIKDGDSLPLLCQKIYKNSAYYTDVAKANNIINFRKLKPGTRILFPPLK